MSRPTAPTRREAIRCLMALGVAGASLGRSGRLLAQVGGRLDVPPAPDPKFPAVAAWDAMVKQVAPGAYAFIQAGGPGHDNTGVSNAGFVVGDDGVLVIDTTVAPLHAKALRDAIRKVTDKPFRHVVITHSHPDHYNGTQYFPGAEVISHPQVRAAILKDVQAGGPALWPKREGQAMGNEPRKIITPDMTFDGKITLYYGPTVIEFLQLGPAHTYGDTIVYLPQHRVMWLGDIAFFGVAPWLHEANPSRWIETCRKIEGMPVDIIVPGHGPIGGKAELADMRGYLELLKKESKIRFDKGMSAGAAAAEIRLGKYDNWVGPERIVMGVQRFYQEFRHQLTPEVDLPAIDAATRDYNAAKKGAK
jgi:cyclase